MATKYVDSTATGAGSGDTRTDAYTTLAAGLTGATASGTVKVSKLHNETGAAGSALTLTSPGTTQATAVQVLCVDFANNDADATGATVSSPTGQSLLLNGYARSRGVTYKSPSSLNYGSLASGWDIEDTGGGSGVGLVLTPAAGSATFGAGTSSFGTTRMGLRNTDITFGASGQSIVTVGLSFSWRGGKLYGSPTTLFSFSSTKSSIVLVEGVDLSNMPASGKLVVTTTLGSTYIFKDCKLPAGMLGNAVASASLVPGVRVPVIRCGAAASNYGNEVYCFEGKEIDAINVTVANGTDAGVSGGTPRSRALTVTANAIGGTPMVSNDIEVWLDTVGSSTTLTIEAIVAGSSAPTNADIWIEGDVLGNTDSPLGVSFSSGLVSPQATPAAYPTSAAVWSGAANVNAGGATMAFKMAVTFTPQIKGPVTFRIKARSGNFSTFYYDSKPTIAGVSIARSYVGPSGVTIHDTGATTQGATVDRPVPVQGRRSFAR